MISDFKLRGISNLTWFVIHEVLRHIYIGLNELTKLVHRLSWYANRKAYRND